MANKADIFVDFPFFCFPKQSKKRKNGIYLWAFSVFRFFRFSSKTKKQKIDTWSIEFSIFLYLAKNGKITVQSIFCYVIHISTNWKDVIDLVKYTVLILNVHTNDLLKYLAFNGRIRASSVEGLGMRQFLAGPSKDSED